MNVVYHRFGIHVARMAGMPRSVVSRVNEILKELEESHNKKELTKLIADIAGHREGLHGFMGRKIFRKISGRNFCHSGYFTRDRKKGYSTFEA